VVKQGWMAGLLAVPLLTSATLIPAEPPVKIVSARASSPVPFSALKPGSQFPPAWTTLSLPDKPATRFSLVDDAGATVVRAESDAAAGTLVNRFRAAADARLDWRWKVDRVVAAADLARKSGDDFAARLYVFFDVPFETLPLATRIKFRIVSLFYKIDLPTAALCYVWDNKHPVGHGTWSAYSDRVRLIVLRSGEAGDWRSEKRNPAADFTAAFGTPAPAITGIALGVDTDQTGERVVAHFGDISLTSK